MINAKNETFKTTVVIYTLTKDFNYTSQFYGRQVAGCLSKGQDLMQGDHVHRVQGGLKWGDHIIPDGTFEKFHVTKTETITYTRRKQAEA